MPARSSDWAGPLVAWYAREARDLPWRRTDDPYAIVVSEFMLQQTRVDTVIDRYARFLTRFPTIEALAAASEDEVLTEWSGLGYYRRARNLHRLAGAVVAEHDGAIPADHDALRALPGVGDYTAAAIGSIAFGVPALTLDGNVKRVLARVLGIGGDPGTSSARRQMQAAARGPLDEHAPGILNQALMELGATICAPTSPTCSSCPLRSECVAHRDDRTGSIPPPHTRRVVRVREAAAVIEREGSWLLFRGQRPGALTPMWEFPTLDSRLRVGDAGGERLAAGLSAHLASLGVHVDGLERIGAIRHAITTRSIHCDVFRAAAATVPARWSGLEAGWFTRGGCRAIPLAAATRKILAIV